MFAAASNRAGGDRAARVERGADLEGDEQGRRTSRDLLARGARGFGGNPQVPGAARPGTRRPGSRRRRPRRPRARAAGAGRRSATTSCNELVIAQGGLTPLLLAVRQGYRGVGATRCSRPAPTSIRSAPATRRAAADRVDQRPFRSRARRCSRTARTPNTPQRQRRDAALRRAQRASGRRRRSIRSRARTCSRRPAISS